ncbi:MAG TPA: hypothetical protein VMD30_06285, partial [Tepidisphaeraceae bacterium]|nr:hypothetical protein [Tepidisphaeraceae bacterium]
MSLRCAICVGYSALLLGLAGCSMFGLMAPPRAASPPAPPPAQAVVSPARPSPPVLPLAMMPNDLGTPGATSIDNSSDSDNQDTARV